MVSKVKVDSIETTAGTGTIALNNQLSGMTVASLPSSGALPALDGSALTNLPAGGVDGIVSTANATAITINSSEQVGIGTSSPDTILHCESSAPYITLENSSAEDINTGREGVLRFQGRRSGGEVVINGQISGHHEGNADDDKGMLIFYTNPGSGQTEKLRILSSGGITFNGDTAAANALDDYEEGEILNALSIDGLIQTSYSSGRGGLRYTKIGNICHCWGYLDTQGATLVATGYVRIRLPFAVVSNGESANVFTTGTQFMYCNTDGGSHKAGWIYLADGSSAVEVTQINGSSISMTSTSHRFYGPFGFTYRTN
jgi:hypothetical protein